MSQENQITLRGYMTAEPKFFQKTPQAVPHAEIRVGCTPRRLNHETGEWYDLPTSYYKVKAWRRLAINAASSLHKGDQVFVRGRFYMNNWVDNQQRPRSTLEIEADTIGHDLAYGWSHYLRGSHPSGKSDAADSGEVARQDTEAPDGDSPNTGLNGPEESAETEPSTETEPPAGDAGFAGASSGEGDGEPAARETQDIAAREPGDVDGAPGPGDAAGVSDTPDDASSLRLEREAVPF